MGGALSEGEAVRLCASRWRLQMRSATCPGATSSPGWLTRCGRPSVNLHQWSLHAALREVQSMHRGCVQVVAHLEPLQQRYQLIMGDEGYLDEVLARGAGEGHFLWHAGEVLSCLPMEGDGLCCAPADKAETAANFTLDNVRQAMGYVPRRRH